MQSRAALLGVIFVANFVAGCGGSTQVTPPTATGHRSAQQCYVQAGGVNGPDPYAGHQGSWGVPCSGGDTLVITVSSDNMIEQLISVAHDAWKGVYNPGQLAQYTDCTVQGWEPLLAVDADDPRAIRGWSTSSPYFSAPKVLFTTSNGALGCGGRKDAITFEVHDLAPGGPPHAEEVFVNLDYRLCNAARQCANDHMQAIIAIVIGCDSYYQLWLTTSSEARRTGQLLHSRRSRDQLILTSFRRDGTQPIAAALTPTPTTTPSPITVSNPVPGTPMGCAPPFTNILGPPPPYIYAPARCGTSLQIPVPQDTFTGAPYLGPGTPLPAHVPPPGWTYPPEWAGAPTVSPWPRCTPPPSPPPSPTPSPTPEVVLIQYEQQTVDEAGNVIPAFENPNATTMTSGTAMRRPQVGTTVDVCPLFPRTVPRHAQLSFSARMSCPLFGDDLISEIQFNVDAYDYNNLQRTGGTAVSTQKYACGDAYVCQTDEKTISIPARPLVYVLTTSAIMTANIFAQYRLCCNNQESYYNSQADAYPEIYPNGWPNGGPLDFPPGKLTFCPSYIRKNGTACPVGDSKVLRGSAVLYYPNRGAKVPPGVTATSSGSYQTHHIMPNACGGPNNGYNGVFLLPLEHTRMNGWWNQMTPLCANSGSRLPLPSSD